MRTLAIVLAVAFCVPTAVFSQSLAEVAKKEKTRREALKGESKVVDDSELRRAKGEGLSITGAEVDESEATQPSLSSSTSSSLSRSSEDRDLPSPAELRARREAHTKALEAARARVARARETLKTCEQASRRPSAFLGTTDCSAAEQGYRSAQDALRRLQGRRP